MALYYRFFQFTRVNYFNHKIRHIYNCIRKALQPEIFILIDMQFVQIPPPRKLKFDSK